MIVEVGHSVANSGINGLEDVIRLGAQRMSSNVMARGHQLAGQHLLEALDTASLDRPRIAAHSSDQGLLGGDGKDP